MMRGTLSLLVLLCCTLAAAQTPPTGDWPSSSKAKTLLVIMAKHPERRVNCRVGNITADDVSCKRHFGREPLIISRGDVRALIVPGQRSDAVGAGHFMIIATVAIATGAFFLAKKTVVGAVLGGFFLWMGTVGPVLYGDKSAAIPDRILYLEPGARLQVPLLWQQP